MLRILTNLPFSFDVPDCITRYLRRLMKTEATLFFNRNITHGYETKISPRTLHTLDEYRNLRASNCVAGAYIFTEPYIIPIIDKMVRIVF